MSDNHIENTIGRYLVGKMSPEEEQSFLKQVAESPELSQQVEMERTIRNAFVENEIIQLRKQIQNDFQNQKKTTHRWKLWGGGLGLLVLVGVGSWFVLNNNQDNNSSIEPKTEQSPILEKYLPTPEDSKEISSENSSIGSMEPLKTKVIPTEQVDENIPNTPKNTSFTPQDSLAVKENPVLNISNRINEPTKYSKTDPCAGFNPTYDVSSIPSYVDANNGSIRFRLGKEKLEFWLASDTAFRSLQFSHLGPGQYLYFVKNKDGCVKGPLSIEVKSTYCKEDHFPKHYISQGNYHPEIHESALTVTVYDKQGRTMAEMNRSHGFEWSLSPSQSLGLYSIEIQYPHGEKCQYSLTLFE